MCCRIVLTRLIKSGMENISSSSDFVIVGDEEELHIHGDEEDGKLRNHGDEGEKQVNVIECGKEDVRS